MQLQVVVELLQHCGACLPGCGECWRGDGHSCIALWLWCELLLKLCAGNAQPVNRFHSQLSTQSICFRYLSTCTCVHRLFECKLSENVKVKANIF